MYFLRAVGCIVPDGVPYPDEPLPLTKEDMEEQEERRKRIEIDNARAYMEAAMHNINKQRKEGGEHSGRV